MKDQKVHRIALCALLTAMALGLSYLERFLPVQLVAPVPGIKLGLANIITLLALYFLGTTSAFSILIVRCLLGAAFGGGLSSLLFSMTGGMMAMAAMAIARRIPFLSIYGVSICGAAAHNIGQVAVGMLLLGSVAVLAYLPLLLCTAIATGFLTGAVASTSFRALIATGQTPTFFPKRKDSSC